MNAHVSPVSFCIALLMAVAILLSPQASHAVNDTLIPGFAAANDSIRLRKVIDRLIMVSKTGDADAQKAGIREVIAFCEERDFMRGMSAGHSTLHLHFSYASQLDSAMVEKKLLLQTYLPHLSCRNQLNFWLISGANHVEMYQTDAAIAEFYRGMAIADSCGLSKLNAYNSMAGVMDNLGKTDEAIRYLQLGAAEVRNATKVDTVSLAVLYNNLSLQYDQIAAMDSAMRYVQMAIALFEHPAFRLRAANIAIRQDALPVADRQLRQAEALIGSSPALQVYRENLSLAQAKLAMRKGDFVAARAFASAALELAIAGKKPAAIASAYGSKAQSLLGQDMPLIDSLQHYLAMQKDEAVVNATVKHETLQKTAEKEQEILLLSSQLKDEAIRKLRLQNYLLYGSLGVLLLGSLAFFLVRRRQRRAGRELERLRKQAVQLQMNPHFFFNSLNSINLFIARNEKDKASDYLVSFARIMRLTLENSQEETVSLEKEVEFLTNYLSLEQLRTKNFDFRIEVDDALLSRQIPPFLIQPLVENSIHHGFEGIDFQGDLLVLIQKQGQRLLVEVIDNGLGIEDKPAVDREDAANTHASFALSILRQRLRTYSPALGQLRFSAGNPAQGHPGTKVCFEIPLI